MLASKLLSACGGEEKIFSDEVFSSWLYTGNGSTQTITNGIDLAGKGGLVWLKCRDVAYGHELADTLRGVENYLSSNTTAAANSLAGSGVTSFNSNGFSVGNDSYTNNSGSTFASWTFRKAPKFFDVVTYTGNGVAGRQIPHSLGIAPGMVIVKRTNSAGSWRVWHTATGTNNTLRLNTTDALLTANTDYVRTADVAAFTVGPHDDVNLSGGAYVAYLFAHDSSADGIVQCGSFTTDGSGNATVNLGWEPQFAIGKNASGTGNWSMSDSMRGLNSASGTGMYLYANTSAAEGAGSNFAISATGFAYVGSPSTTVIYLAIRRPNKPPTTGTQVYNAIARTGTGAAATVTGVGFAPDSALITNRGGGFGEVRFDRLRGAGRYLVPSATSAEVLNPSMLSAFGMDGVTLDANGYTNNSANTYINHFFKRAPGVFDQVCYTGDGASGRAVSHGLGTIPTMIIGKSRSATDNWWVYHADILSSDPNGVLSLNQASASTAFNGQFMYGNGSVIVAPTATQFTVSSGGSLNDLGVNYTAYLFATKAGISKVFSFTGNGTNQNIECGFTTGARFVLLKRTDSTGNWLVADTARGIVAGNDPSLALNSTAAEVTTLDWIDPYSGGFNIVQEATNNANVNGATYIGLAFS